jgi:diguanylate cyclase (GGDEF)-like protein
MRRVSIAMFVVGGVVCLSGVWITQVNRSGQVAQGSLAVVFLVTGLGLIAFREAPRWLYEAMAIWGVTLISVLIAVGQPFGMAPFFYLWPVVYMAYFSTVRKLQLTYAWMVVTFAVGLALNTMHDMKLDTFTGTAATVGIMAALVATMTRQEARLRDELAQAAETDPLTGLLNRRSFNPRFAGLLTEAVASGRALSVVMIDIDHFKRLNDEYGHLVGDEALQEIARILVAQSRDHDLVSRFGGEEFAVALPGADAAAATAYAERVAAALTAPLAAGMTLSVSAGISSLTDREPADLLLSRADEALYAAKEGGRCRLASWGDGIVVGPRFGESTAA